MLHFCSLLSLLCVLEFSVSETHVSPTSFPICPHGFYLLSLPPLAILLAVIARFFFG